MNPGRKWLQKSDCGQSVGSGSLWQSSRRRNRPSLVVRMFPKVFSAHGLGSPLVTALAGSPETRALKPGSWLLSLNLAALQRQARLRKGCLPPQSRAQCVGPSPCRRYTPWRLPACLSWSAVRPVFAELSRGRPSCSLCARARRKAFAGRRVLRASKTAGFFLMKKN